MKSKISPVNAFACPMPSITPFSPGYLPGAVSTLPPLTWRLVLLQTVLHRVWDGSLPPGMFPTSHGIHPTEEAHSCPSPLPLSAIETPLRPDNDPDIPKTMCHPPPELICGQTERGQSGSNSITSSSPSSRPHALTSKCGMESLQCPC